MAGPAQVAPEDLLSCEKCHGFYAVEVPTDGSEPRIRCNKCGHIREVDVAPVQKADDEKKWTVIGPDGKVMTFGSWEKLVESRAPSPPSRSAEERKASASALLDVTPTAAPVKAKLALAELESEPFIPTANPLPLSTRKSTPPPPPARTASIKPAVPISRVPAPLPPADDVEEAPLSLRDAIADDEDESPISLSDAVADDHPDDQSHELLSLKDLVVVPTPEDSVPPPPVRGALRTLPPTPSKVGATAPPPTITFDSKPPPSVAPKTETKDPPKVASKGDKSDGKADNEKAKTDKAKTDTAKADKAKSDKAKSDTPGKGDKSDGKGDKSERKPVAAAVSATSAEEPKRGWVLPSLVVVGIAVILWRMMAASPAPTKTETSPTPTAPATSVATATTPPPEPTVIATAEPTASAPTTATAVASVALKPETTTPTAKKPHEPTAPASGEAPAPVEKSSPPVSDTASMSELLDKAGSARRSGDFAAARGLYERVLKQNAGNVEANGGLGDVARAQGDLAAAKASYERALATSPSYGPALLGLADTEWDLGDKAGAQRRYAQIVERMGERAPERAKQRSAGE